VKEAKFFNPFMVEIKCDGKLHLMFVESIERLQDSWRKIF
jgi:hypothetical protein